MTSRRQRGRRCSRRGRGRGSSNRTRRTLVRPDMLNLTLLSSINMHAVPLKRPIPLFLALMYLLRFLLQPPRIQHRNRRMRNRRSRRRNRRRRRRSQSTRQHPEPHPAHLAQPNSNRRPAHTRLFLRLFLFLFSVCVFVLCFYVGSFCFFVLFPFIELGFLPLAVRVFLRRSEGEGRSGGNWRSFPAPPTLSNSLSSIRYRVLRMRSMSVRRGREGRSFPAPWHGRRADSAHTGCAREGGGTAAWSSGESRTTAAWSSCESRTSTTRRRRRRR